MDLWSTRCPFNAAVEKEAAGTLRPLNSPSALGCQRGGCYPVTQRSST